MPSQYLPFYSHFYPISVLPLCLFLNSWIFEQTKTLSIDCECDRTDDNSFQCKLSFNLIKAKQKATRISPTTILYYNCFSFIYTFTAENECSKRSIGKKALIWINCIEWNCQKLCLAPLKKHIKKRRQPPPKSMLIYYILSLLISVTLQKIIHYSSTWISPFSPLLPLIHKNNNIIRFLSAPPQTAHQILVPFCFASPKSG